MTEVANHLIGQLAHSDRQILIKRKSYRKELLPKSGNLLSNKSAS